MNLKDRLSSLKTVQISLNTDLVEFFKNSDFILGEIKENYHQFSELLEIETLNVTEFDILEVIVNKFKKNFERLEKLLTKNKGRVEILKQIRDNAFDIIEEFKIVKEVETYTWSDHVSAVKQDSLYSINSEQLEHLLDSLEKVSSYTEKKEEEELPSKTCNLFKDLVNLLGMFEDEFIPNVVYRRPTEIMRKVIGVLKNIDKEYLFYTKIISNYFKSTIEDCFKGLERLEAKYLTSRDQIYKGDKLVKLKSLGSPKSKAIPLFDLRDTLKYGLEG